MRGLAPGKVPDITEYVADYIIQYSLEKCKRKINNEGMGSEPELLAG